MSAADFIFLAAGIGVAFGVAAVVDRVLARAGCFRAEGERADKW